MIDIASLKHKVILCKQADVVLTAGDLTLKREKVLTAWAAIHPKKASTFNEDGDALGKNTSGRNMATHVIKMRYRYDIELTHLAWFYEERRKSVPRWFKVLRTMDYDDCWVLECRLVSKGDDILAPTEADEPSYHSPLPNGVQL